MEPQGGPAGDPGLRGEAPLRVVALGASNLTRGFPAVVWTARREWGPGVGVLAALGLGRSYGSPSRVLVRSLPGILESGLWRELERAPPRPTRGLITDVGNDILYGFGAGQILAWVEECLDRLQRHAGEAVVTDLPLHNIRALPRWKYLLFRSVLFPRCRLSQAQVLDVAEAVSEGLAKLAAARQARLVRVRPEWYGFDPIHFRPAMWRCAWREILCVDPDGGPPRGSWIEALRLLSMFPERQWLLGVETRTRQPGVALGAGGRVWLY